MANPIVRWFSGKLSPTKARKGSIETLIEASIIQSIPAAIHKVGELGMKNKAAEAKIAPARK